jgi:AraC-like DNA-binding protein
MRQRSFSYESSAKGRLRLGVNGIGFHSERRGTQRIIPAIGAKRPFFSFIFNHEPVSIRVDGSWRELPACSLSLWDSSPSVDYGSLGSAWRISWLQVWGSAFEALLDELSLSPNSHACLPDERAALRLFSAFSEELESYAEPSLPLLQSLLRCLLLEFKRGRQGALRKREAPPPELLAAKALIERRCFEGLTLSSLAASASLSPQYFCRKYKACFGQPPMDYLMGLRLEEVARSLVDSGLSLKELAARTGFGSFANFSKTYKRRYGLSPAEHRRKLLGAAKNG